MAKSKPPLVRLPSWRRGRRAISSRSSSNGRAAPARTASPIYTCKFRDTLRTAVCMIWSDGEFYQACETEWREGQFFKIRGIFQEHPKFGPQIDIKDIRIVE